MSSLLEPQLPFEMRVSMWMTNSPDFRPRPEEVPLFLRSCKKYRLKMKPRQLYARKAKMDVG